MEALQRKIKFRRQWQISVLWWPCSAWLDLTRKSLGTAVKLSQVAGRVHQPFSIVFPEGDEAFSTALRFPPKILSLFLHSRSTFVCSVSVPFYLNMNVQSKQLHVCSYIWSMGSPREAGWLNTILYMRVWVRFYLLFKCVDPQIISFWSLRCVSKLRKDTILSLLRTKEHKTQSIQSFAWIKTEHGLESRPPSLSRDSLILLMRPRVCSLVIDKIIGLSKNRQDLWDRHGIRSVMASSWVCWEWTSWGIFKRHTQMELSICRGYFQLSSSL